MERRRSTLRTAAVWNALTPVLSPEPAAGGPALRIIDLGGGTGGFAVRLAGLGHHVTVVDPSPDALASLERRAAEAAVTVAAVLGDADTLLDSVDAATADLVLCHGVLELVDSPAGALAGVGGALRPGGSLSLVASQRSGAVLGRVLAGHLADARTLLEDDAAPTDPTGRRFTADELRGLLADAGFTVAAIHGVRIFTDHVSSAVVDSDPAAADELRVLEAAASAMPEYLAMATQLHLLATR